MNEDKARYSVVVCKFSPNFLPLSMAVSTIMCSMVKWAVVKIKYAQTHLERCQELS